MSKPEWPPQNNPKDKTEGTQTSPLDKPTMTEKLIAMGEGHTDAIGAITVEPNKGGSSLFDRMKDLGGSVNPVPEQLGKSVIDEQINAMRTASAEVVAPVDVPLSSPETSTVGNSEYIDPLVRRFTPTMSTVTPTTESFQTVGVSSNEQLIGTDSADKIAGSTPFERKLARRKRANEAREVDRSDAPGTAEDDLSVDPTTPPTKAETKAEIRDTLQRTVAEVMSYSKIAEASGAHASPEKFTMDEAEQAYLTAYKSYYENNSALSRFGKEALNKTRANLRLEDSGELDALTALKNTYNESRARYAEVIEDIKKEAIANHPVSDQFRARTLAKFEKIKNSQTEETKSDGVEPDFEEFLENANKERMEKIGGYIRFKEVIRPAAEKKIEAREAALGEKGQNTVEKFLSFVGKKNAELEEKYGKSEAKIIRVVATAAIATTSFGFLSAATGAALATVATAALGYGGQRVARGLFSAFAGAKVASFAGNKREISARKEKVEAEKMLTNSKYAEGLSSVKELEQYDSLREKNISTSKESTIQRKVLLRKALVGFLVGAGTTAALAELMSFLPSTEHLLENAGTGNPNTVDSTSASEVAPANTTSQIASSHTESVPSANETVPTPIPAENISTTHIDAASIIDGKTNNADKLFGEFRSVIDLEKTIGAQTNPAVEKFLSLGKNQDSISLALGFQNEHSLSAVMHAGDRIGVVNNEVVFVNANGATHTLISADGEIHKLNMGAVHTTPPAEASSTIEHPTKTNTIEATTPVEPTLDTNPVDHVNTTVEELNRAEFEKHFATNQGANTGGIITTSTEPSLPENSSSVQTVSEVANTLPEGSFINPHNLTIDSTKPHAYLFSDTDGKPMLDVNGEKMYTIFGGKEDEPYTAAEDFLKKHPGTSVRFEVERKNILGLVTKRVLELGSTPNGAIVMHPPSVEGVPLPSPATDSFTEIDPYEFNK